MVGTVATPLPRLQRARHSRTVGVLKVLLPLLALVSLSLVFLLARTIDPRQAIAAAEIDVQERARDPRLSGARFAGVTEDGAALTIQTDTARSSPDGVMRLAVTGIALLLEGPAGEMMAIEAGAGVLDRGLGRFAMQGGIEIIATPGYRLTTDSANGFLDSTLIQMPQAVSGSAPAGEISAGRLEMRADSSVPPRYRLVFSDGVRFNYQPEY